MYYEIFDNPTAAIEREKQLKKWHREWKIRTIEHENPNWDDLSANL
jgi:putative endonuclease